MFSSNDAGEKAFIPSASSFITSPRQKDFQARVTLSCPEKEELGAKLVLLPQSLEELLAIGAKKFRFNPTKVLTKEWAEVEDIEIIRDGDHLILVSEVGNGNSKREQEEAVSN